MVEYPHGRSGEPICYYNGTVSEEKLRESSEVGDNDVIFDGDKAYLYEAPAEDDSGRGHFSVWSRKSGGRFKRIDAISGDDGMCYNRFEESK